MLQERTRHQDQTDRRTSRLPEKGSRFQELIHRVEQAVGEIHDSESFRRYLDVQARFHRYSWRNVALILAQRRDATQVAGYVTWRKLGRTVRRGEKGIGILVPMPRRVSTPTKPVETDEVIGAGTEQAAQLAFGVGVVFDISQTEGAPLPEVDVPVLAGEDPQGLLGRLESLARDEGLAVKRDGSGLSESAMGHYDPHAREIVLSEAEPLQMTKTLAHELAHHFAGATSSSPEEETLAEAGAYVVCAHFGLDTGARSFPYIAIWSRESATLNAALGKVQTIAAKMIDRIEGASQSPTAA